MYDGKREIRLLLVISGLGLIAYGVLGIATGRGDLESAVVIGAFVVGVVLWRGDVLAS